ncbi:MAG: polysaccharide lyase family 7 protein [Alphaproteobacteria bacterium]
MRSGRRGSSTLAVPWIVAGILGAAGCAAAAAETAMAPSDSGRFDLTNWKLTLPVDEDGESDDDAIEIEDLAGYADPDWFYATPEGAMVFTAPVDGATTGGSRYPRCELREMIGGARAAWTLAQGGTLSATVSVDRVPERDDGTPGRLIVGQIHGEDDELVRLYYQDGTVYFMNEHAGPDDEELRFDLPDSAGRLPDIGLGERFAYLIEAGSDRLTVELHADGRVYRSDSVPNPVWQDDRFYFKAGVYLGVNDDSGSGIGRVSFYALDVGHTPGIGRGGLQ